VSDAVPGGNAGAAEDTVCGIDDLSPQPQPVWPALFAAEGGSAVGAAGTPVVAELWTFCERPGNRDGLDGDMIEFLRKENAGSRRDTSA
jgi:hypothetical protein